MLIEKGYNPSDVPSKTDAELYKLAKEVFPEMFKQTREGKRGGFFLKYDENTPKQAYTKHNLSNTNAERISFGKSAFTSFKTLTSVMGHEFDHVMNLQSGQYNLWLNESGNADYAENRMEISARSWQLNHWGPTNINQYLKFQFGNLNHKLYD